MVPINLPEFKLKLRTLTNSKGVMVYHFDFVKTKSETIVPFKCNMLEKWYIMKKEWENFQESQWKWLMG